MTVRIPMTDLVAIACEKHWETYKSDCSGFVKAVASDLGLSLTGQANDLSDQIQKSPWLKLKDGAEAQQKAALGFFVLGALKATPNGHVVVVVPGELSGGKYPTAYWGSLGGTGKKKTTINWSWTATDRDLVSYSYYPHKPFREVPIPMQVGRA